MDMTDAPQLKSYIKPSVVIERGGRKIGIIGYVTTDTPASCHSIHNYDSCSKSNLLLVENCQTRSSQVQIRNTGNQC